MKKISKQKHNRTQNQNQKERESNINILNGSILSDKILVKPIFIESQDGVYTPQQYEDKAEFGEVIMVGTGRLLDNGTVVKPTVKKGDIVYFEKYSAKKIRNNGIDYLIIREDDCDWFSR